MTRKSEAKFEEKRICCSKNDRNLIGSLKSHKKLDFDWFLLCKVYNV